jgi:4-hydroxy 2-oxovalerate aldolase
MTAATGNTAPKIRLTDSTLRDGSHALAHRFTEGQVRGVVHALDAAGVEVIEVTHGDGLGGSSFNYGFSAVDDIKLVAAAVDEAARAKIAVLLLPGLGTVHDPAARPRRGRVGGPEEPGGASDN